MPRGVKSADSLPAKPTGMEKELVIIDRFFPSRQTCGYCGYRNKEAKDLSVRLWECPECGALHNRDINAAQNILQRVEKVFSPR